VPGLDYKHAVSVVGANAAALDAPRFYDGSPGRELAKCPRCLRRMDALFPHDDKTPGCAQIARRQAALRAELARQEKAWNKPSKRRERGATRTASANADKLAAAVAIIRDTAARHDEFSANDTRDAMEEAGVTGPVVGVAFRTALDQGAIEPTGRRVKSTQRATNAHRVDTYRRKDEAA
jgi:hypothetical protein